MMHRYPGSRSFTSDYRHLFFGRDDEKQELFRLIVLNDLVVLFGESGSGKTSLLQAGVCPELEERQYKPVFIRLNNPAESPEAQVCTQLKEGGYLPADLPEDRSLWEYFSRFWYVDLGEVFKPVIVFDQFEELFTLYSPEQRAAFIAQFAAIVNRRPPAGLAPEVASPPPAKFVFSLRSDFLYLLDELSADIPAILRCRFQLRPLDRKNAESAITRPAAMPGDFASPEFGYSPEALEGILEALGRKGASSLGGSTAPSAQQNTVQLGEIAAFQLQMVCKYLEGKVIGQEEVADFQITPAFYGGAEGIEQIINEFYQAVLEKIPAAEQEAVQKLLARGLIRNGRRIMMEASAMGDEYGVAQASLELLHAERLLKRETRKGELYFEISHDTLVAPVMESFKAIEEAELLALERAEAERLRLKAEARERELEAERQRAEEAERLKNEALQGQKRARVRGYLAGLVAIVAIGLGFFALEKQRAAEKQTLTAYANDLAYKSQTALRDGDRTAAFRLAEFAHLYVDEDNQQMTRALMEALYCNENPAHPPLPWASTLQGHDAAVISVCFSPDGLRLATGARDNTAKVWDLQTGKTIMTLQGHSATVNSVCFSPDGRSLATGSFDNTSKIWDLQTGKAIMTLQGHDAEVNSVRFSPDGLRLATGAHDNTAKIWDLQTGKAIMTLQGHYAEVTSICFSPDGLRLATGSLDNTSKIWDLQNAKAIMTLQGHSTWVTSVCFSPDGLRLATGSLDNTSKIWDLQTGKAIMTLQGHDAEVNSVRFSPDGLRLATGARDNTAKIWDLQTGKAIMTLRGHSAEVTSVCFSPDGLRLSTGSWDNTAKTWDLQNVKAIKPLQGYSAEVTSVCFSPDGLRLATGARDNTAKIWDIQTGKAIMTLKGHSATVTSVCFSPDGRRLATGARDNTAKIWDIQNAKTIMTLRGHDAEVTSVCFSPDGHRLATGGRDNAAKIWDIQTAKAIMTLQGHDAMVTSVCFSPDGRRLATGFSDNTAKIWDIQAGKAIMTLKGHSAMVTSVCFSTDGRRLATGAYDNTAKIWNLQNAKAIMTLQGHDAEVNSICFSPDGRRLATGSSDNTAKIWDLQNAKAIMTLKGHSASVYRILSSGVTSVCFSPDGRRLATGADDNTAKIWETTVQGFLMAGGRVTRMAGLRLPQLIEYGLGNLLDLKSGNEAILLASRNTWQIAAFADLYTDKIVNSLPQKADYARAKRLYQACQAADVDKEYFEKKLADLERVWKEKTE